MTNERPVQFVAAGTLRRGAAFLIDALAVSPLLFAVIAVASLVLPENAASTPPILLTFIVLTLTLYFAVLPTRMEGRTVGQRALKIWVISGATGDIPTTATLLVRGACKYLITAGLCLPLSIVFFIIGWAPLPDFGGVAGAKSGGKTTLRLLHDRLTNTYTVTPG